MPKTVELADGVFAVTADSDSIYDGWGANQGFILTKDGPVVIDTGFTRRSAEWLLHEVKKRTKRPVKVVISTHDHSDHVFGNCIFTGTGAVVLAQSNCRNRLHQLGARRMRGYRGHDRRLRGLMDGLSIEPPVLTYSESTTMTYGGKLLDLIHPPSGAHTTGDTMVYLPDDKILFAGDVVWFRYHPNLEDANVPGWISALRNIPGLGASRIAPGHGKPCSNRDLAALSSYIDAFDSQLRQLASEGVAPSKAASMLNLLGSDGWDLKMIVERNVKTLYKKYRRRA